MTFVDYYDPETDSIVSHSSTYGELENKHRAATRKFVADYIAKSPEDKAAFDAAYPNWWNSNIEHTGGVKPGAVGYHPPPDDIVLITEPSKKVVPSKINVTTGAGAPGGFSVSSLKNPLTEISNTTSGLAAMAAQASQLSSYLSAAKLLGVALPSSVTNSINASMAKLNTLKSAATAKISSIKLHVPNFSVPHVTVPSLPKAPAFPPLPALPKLPTLPSTPSTPSTSIPSLPSTPTAPKLPT